MIIDFHTHIYPDSMASMLVKTAARKAKIPVYGDGTLASLIDSMKASHVDLSVVLPVLVTPKQFHSINTMFHSINECNPELLCFGAMHPNTENYMNEIDYLVDELKFKGIKLHPNMQRTYINDPKYIRMIDYALQKGLIVVIHAGKEPFTPNCDFSSPVFILDMLRSLTADTNKIVLAHVGGCNQWDLVEDKLVGLNVHLDLSYSLDKINPVQLTRIIQKHGCDKILFGSDAPWSSQDKSIQIIKSLPLTSFQLKSILSKNATDLLNYTI